MYHGGERFHFKVGDSSVGVLKFEEVTGLEIEDDLIGSLLVRDLVGYHQVYANAEGFSSVVFRGGDIQGDRFLLDFFMGRGIDSENPKKITVTLLDKRSNPVSRWIFEDAYPTGVNIVQNRTDQQSIYIDSVVIMYKNVAVDAAIN